MDETHVFLHVIGFNDKMSVIGSYVRIHLHNAQITKSFIEYTWMIGCWRCRWSGWHLRASKMAHSRTKPTCGVTVWIYSYCITSTLF